MKNQNFKKKIEKLTEKDIAIDVKGETSDGNILITTTNNCFLRS